MGVTIYSKNISCDIGYGGLFRLRKTVAKLCPQDIRDHYMALVDDYFTLIQNDPGLKLYDAITDNIYAYHQANMRKIIDFLYATDIKARFTYGTAKVLLSLIGEYDDNYVYGYAGWGDCAMKFKDFKQLLEDAVKTKSYWGWK